MKISNSTAEAPLYTTGKGDCNANAEIHRRLVNLGIRFPLSAYDKIWQEGEHGNSRTTDERLFQLLRVCSFQATMRGMVPRPRWWNVFRIRWVDHLHH